MSPKPYLVVDSYILFCDHGLTSHFLSSEPLDRDASSLSPKPKIYTQGCQPEQA